MIVINKKCFSLNSIKFEIVINLIENKAWAAKVVEAAKQAEEAEEIKETECSNEVFIKSCYLRVNNISARVDEWVCAYSRTSADCSQARQQHI